jgi:hypothetical protein
MNNLPSPVPQPQAATGEVFEIDDAPPSAAALPPPRIPTAGVRYEEVILPSGRVVRMRRVRTDEYLSAKERAAADCGDPARNPDPRGLRFSGALDRELLGLCVVAYTAPLEWSPVLEADVTRQQEAHAARMETLPPEQRTPFLPAPPKLDELIATVPPEAWHPCTPLELMGKGEHGLTTVFDSIADWEVLTSCAGRLLLPVRDLSGIVGKAVSVVR